MEKKKKSYFLSRFKFLKLKDFGHIILAFLAFIPAIFAKIFIRDFWLVCEDRNDARDNGYWFFRYVREHYPKQKIAYAINKKSVDYSKVKPLGKIIRFGGFSHWFWYFVADKNISSQKNGKPNAAVCYLIEVVLKLRRKNRYFLQHGVIINDNEFVHYKNTYMYRFVVSTQDEYDFVTSRFGYPEGAISLCGLCRFDNLNDFVVDKDTILIMPTWRQWISKGVEMKEIEGSDVFEETNYFKHWSSLINNEKLIDLLEKNNKRLIFYLHRNMQKFVDCFKSKSDRVIVASSQEYDIATLLKKSALLITDYSSVFFDFVYMKKPIIFYQFDEKIFRKYQYADGYFDYKDTPLAEWCEKEDELVSKIKSSIENDYKLKDEKAVKKYFPSIDGNNCQRNYEMIKGKKKK